MDKYPTTELYCQPLYSNFTEKSSKLPSASGQDNVLVKGTDGPASYRVETTEVWGLKAVLGREGLKKQLFHKEELSKCKY